MNTDAWGGLVAGSLMVLANLVVQQVTVAAAYGVLGPNRFLGVRTDATRHSPQAWQAGHRAALLPLGVGTLVGLALAAAAVVLAGEGSRTAGVVLTLASAGVLGVSVLVASGRADPAAVRAAGQDPDDR